MICFTRSPALSYLRTLLTLKRSSEISTPEVTTTGGQQFPENLWSFLGPCRPGSMRAPEAKSEYG